MSIGGKIVQLMKQEGMTQKELADKINVTEASMSRYLKDKRIPRIDVLANIAKVFNVSIEFLQGEDEVNEVCEIKRLVARNATNMTQEEKMELIKILTQN